MSVTLPVTLKTDAVFTTGKALDFYVQLSKEPSFATLCTCFDMVKINNIRGKIMVDSIKPPEAVEAGKTPLLAIAFDRNGTDQDIFNFTNVSNYSSSKIIQVGNLSVGKPLEFSYKAETK